MIPLVLLAASVAQAEYRVWVETTPLRDSDREIVLADARLFGVTRDEAKRYAAQAAKARQARQAEMETWNAPYVAKQWERECLWREDCWQLLATALGAKPSVEWESRWWWLGDKHTRRIHALYELRDAIGFANFYAGSMPSPIPQYKFNPNR